MLKELNPDKKLTTLTNRVSAIEIKMLSVHFRMLKIKSEQEIIQGKLLDSNLTNNEKIEISFNSFYNILDMFITFENLNQLIKDIFSTKELSQFFGKNILSLLNKTKKISEKWRPIRNKIGAHIEIEIIEELCKNHNYKGVLISEDPIRDLSMYNLLILDVVANSTRKTNDIFKRDLNFKENLTEDVKLFVDTLTKDWIEAFAYFEPMMEFIYKVGKDEKLANTSLSEGKGIIVGD